METLGGGDRCSDTHDSGIRDSFVDTTRSGNTENMYNELKLVVITGMRSEDSRSDMK